MAVTTQGKSTKQLREENDKLVSQARALWESKDADDWKTEDEAIYNAICDDCGKLRDAIKRREQLSEIESSSATLAPLTEGNPNEKPNRNVETKPREIKIREGAEYLSVPVGHRGSEAYQKSFRQALISGAKGLAPEQVAALRSDNDEQAGYLVASEQFAAGLLKDVDDLLFIRRYARIHTVPEATSLGIKKRTARMSTFGWSSELTVSTEDSSLKYGKKTLTPHHCTGAVKVSRDLLRRSMGGAESEVRYEMARDAGEVMEDAYLTGNGAQRPLGVFTASADGISTARDVSDGNTSTKIGADGLINAKYSLKGQYRAQSLRWLFHRDAVKQLTKLKDGEGQYLWRNGLVDGEPDRLLGYPVDESERVPNTFTSGLYVGLLAAWENYEIADALDMEVQVLLELYAATNQVGYIGRLKTDGMPTREEGFARVKLG